MHVIVLSDHTGDMVQQLGGQRAARDRADAAAHALALSRRQERKDALDREIRQALTRFRPLALLAALGGRLGMALKSPPPPPAAAAVNDQEQIWSSGHNGELLVRNRLAAQLDDDWTLLTGYENRQGEIDQILIGPNGVFAIEIKYVNGVIHAEGDRWWLDKFDQYGNLVAQGRVIADGRRRGPSLQLNEAADLLEKFLVGRVAIDRICRAVIFSHPRAAIARIERPTVDFISAGDNLQAASLLACAGPVGIDAANTSRIVALVKRDHDFHAAHKRKPQARSSPNRS